MPLANPEAAMAGAIDNFDLREQIAHIDQVLADERKRQERQLPPWAIALFSMTAGAALFAAGAAFVRFCLV